MVTAEVIADALDGISYPITKDDILAYARERNAPEDVLEQLEEMDSDYYHSLDEVYNQFGMEPCAPPGWEMPSERGRSD